LGLFEIDIYSWNELYIKLKGGKDRQTFFKVLDNINKVEPTFGKPYFKVEIDEAELESIRQELNG